MEGNRRLIERMEHKIAATLARIWGEPANSEAAETEVAEATAAT